PLNVDVLPGFHAGQRRVVVLVDARRDDDEVNVRVCGEVGRAAVSLGLGGEFVGRDGAAGCLDARVTEGRDCVF
ncbi:hypothetical protein CH063_09717, partial [Colletotrichum higginsianum]